MQQHKAAVAVASHFAWISQLTGRIVNLKLYHSRTGKLTTMQQRIKWLAHHRRWTQALDFIHNLRYLHIICPAHASFRWILQQWLRVDKESSSVWVRSFRCDNWYDINYQIAGRYPVRRQTVAARSWLARWLTRKFCFLVHRREKGCCRLDGLWVSARCWYIPHTWNRVPSWSWWENVFVWITLAPFVFFFFFFIRLSEYFFRF